MANAPSDSLCPAIFLRDEPAEKDAFGAHARLANTIFEMIRHDNKGKAIALLGTWGSGKSTVIKLIDGLLRHPHSDQDIKMVTFDAWEHEKDSLRRAFLENLTMILEETEWANPNQWMQMRDSISRRERTQEITTTPRLTRFGILFAFVSIVSPLGLALWAKLGSQSVPAWMPVAGYAVSWLPLFIGLATLLIAKLRKKTLTEATAFIINKQQTTVHSHTIETPEPTSIEFQNYFTQILNETLKDKPRRKLVVVIDNLDRVREDDVLDIWSIMQTFFANSKRGNEIQDRLWVIVPFDKGKLSVRPSQDHDKDDRIESLVERTFQVQFNVPEPVLSRLYEYMTSSLQEALPSHDSSDFYDVYRIFASRHASDTITPRTTRAFINQLVTVHRLWHDSIPLQDQAIFVLCQRNNVTLDELLKASKTKTAPRELDKAFDFGSTKLYEHLVSMHLCIPPDEALQTILRSELELSFQNDDMETVMNWRTVPGFWQACEYVIHEISKRPELDGQLMLSAARILDRAACGIETPNSNRMWQQLTGAARRIKTWGDVTPNTGESIVALIRHAIDTEETALLVRSIVQGAKNIVLWVDEVRTVVDYLLKSDAFDDYSHALQVPFSLDATANEYENNPRARELFDLIPCQFDEAQCTQWFLQRIQNGQLQTYEVDFYWLLVDHHQVSIDTVALMSAIQQRIYGNQGLPNGELSKLMSLMIRIRDTDKMDKTMPTIINIVTQGYLHHHLSRTQGNVPPEDQAAILLALLQFSPNNQLSPHGNIWDSQHGFNYLVSVANNYSAYKPVYVQMQNYAKKYNQADAILSWNGADSYRWQLGRSLIQQIIETDDAIQWFGVQAIIHEWKSFDSWLDVNHKRQLVSQLLRAEDFMFSLAKSEFTDPILGLAALVFETQIKMDQRILEKLVATLRARSKADWINTLAGDDVVIRLTKSLLDLGMSLDLRNHAADALREQAFQGQVNSCTPVLYNALAPSQRAVLLRDLRDYLASNQTASFQIVLQYDEELIAHGQLAERADELVRTTFRRLLESGEDDLIAWIAGALERVPLIWRKCSPEVQQAFIERVTGANLESMPGKALQDVLNKLCGTPREVAASEVSDHN
jgi:energy-coupling factor transporter ATP-binding protein EcfA2